MYMKLIEKTDKTMEIEVSKEDESILTPMKQWLLEQAAVESATVLKPHPVLANPRLYVEVSKGKPETVVKNAAKAVRQDVDALETEFLNVTQE